MVVAVAALVAAIGGTAVAGVATISKLSKSEKKQVKKIAAAEANRKIDSRAGGLSVLHAKSADSAASAATATSADSAKTAAQAAHATTAAQAADAAAVGGVRTVKVDIASSTDTTVPILAEGGITMEALCNSGQAEVAFKPTPGNGVLSVARYKESGEVDNSFQRTFETQVIFATVNFNNLRGLTLGVNYVGTDGTTITGDIVMAQEGAIAPCVLGGTLFVRS